MFGRWGHSSKVLVCEQTRRVSMLVSCARGRLGGEGIRVRGRGGEGKRQTGAAGFGSGVPAG
eukprot:7187054-Prymnesium_polylepis.1